jgi:2-amino-4-hydroxy-6-hydroxymethyldihydropteridine diphosphokinase
MRRKGHSAYLGLGSNLGDKEMNLRRALQLLAQAEIQILKASPLYATEPVDFKDQDWFLNQVVAIQTPLSPRDLLAYCLQIEQNMGRQRTASKGPRNIDLDVLLYSDLIIQEKGLTIPHPMLHTRRFVLVPLATLAPEVVHPVLRQPISTLLDRCPDPAQVVLFK